MSYSMAVAVGGISALTTVQATRTSRITTSRWAPGVALLKRSRTNTQISFQRRQLHVVSSAATKEAASVSQLEGSEGELTSTEEDLDNDDGEEDDSLAPNAFEVQSLLMELCDETKIAELRLKMGSFVLHVKRDVGGKGRSSVEAPLAPPVPSRPMIDEIAAPPAPTAAAPSKKVEHGDGDIDEGLLYVTSPKVGIFRRGRSLKGSQGKPMVNEGSVIKVGQVTSYLEQLGTQLAVESEHAGEVVSFLVEDGDPVGFADPLMTIRPSFPGIKMLT